MFDNSQFFSGAKGFYPLTIDQSLRFNDNDSAYLSRTPASAGNRKTWTWSGWVKRCSVGADQTIFGAGNDGDNQFTFIWQDTGQLLWNHEVSNTRYLINTSALYRDFSAWYHLVLEVDTTQATDSNRVKLYVNGVQQAVNVVLNGYPPLNADTFVNSTSSHGIGSSTWLTTNYGDFYLAEVHFTDGTAYDADDFGELKSGVWVAKTPSVTYGTNGFKLTFEDSAAIGDDTSGNGNDWTVNNLVASDVVLDSPTDNFCTLNPLLLGSAITMSNGNLDIAKNTSNDWRSVYGTVLIPTSGKWYWELTAGDEYVVPGITLASGNLIGSVNTYPTDTLVSYTYYGFDGQKYTGPGNAGTSYGATYTTNDVIGIAFDADAGTLTFYKNNVSQGTAFSSLTAQYLPTIGCNTSGVTHSLNFGQLGFTYTPPTGYLALSTANLPDPAIDPAQGESPEDYFNTVLYTGNGTAIGSGGNAITGVGFQPDWIWIKERNGAASHGLYDAVRGVTEQLESDTTAAETTESEGLTAFGTDGFTVGSLAQVNTNTDTYVAWNWKANGSGVSNTDGTITSTVSANTESGFSIVSYTGTGANATVGHGLGVAPSMVIVKERDGTGFWVVGHDGITWNSYLRLNDTTAIETSIVAWNNTAPTSTTVSLGTSNILNGSGSDLIMYAFAEKEGFSKFGSYVGNGSTDGPFVYTGFRPSFVMVKVSSAAGERWQIHDTSREAYNGAIAAQFADGALVDNTSSTYAFDILSNGFKPRTSHEGSNYNGQTLIYMAFAENPFKYANAR